MTSVDNVQFQSHYIPNTQQEQVEMLATLGLSSIDELFLDIPAEHRNPPWNCRRPFPNWRFNGNCQPWPPGTGPWAAGHPSWGPVRTITLYPPSSRR